MQRKVTLIWRKTEEAVPGRDKVNALERKGAHNGTG